jgi:hypothetical protein
MRECPECEGECARIAGDGSYVECGTCDGAGEIE